MNAGPKGVGGGEEKGPGEEAKGARPGGGQATVSAYTFLFLFYIIPSFFSANCAD